MFSFQDTRQNLMKGSLKIPLTGSLINLPKKDLYTVSTRHCLPTGFTRRCTLKIKQRYSIQTLADLRNSEPPFRGPCLLRKEVIQPHLPIRLPCYDFTPIIRPTFGRALLAVRLRTSGVPDSHGVTGGVYKARERIHRGMLIRDY